MSMLRSVTPKIAVLQRNETAQLNLEIGNSIAIDIPFHNRASGILEVAQLA